MDPSILPKLVSKCEHSQLRARPHMHLNIIINSFDIVLTLSLRQVSREHSESDKYVFLHYIPQSRETALRAEPCRIFSSDARKLRRARTRCPKIFKKFELHIWKKKVIKIKLSEGNFLTLKFSGGVTSIDVTI